MNLLLIVLAITLPSFSYQEGLEQFSKEVKCLVCQITVNEMNKAIGKIDPTRTIEVPSYGMSKEVKTVPYAKSEMYLTELMETVCAKLDGHGRAWYKDTDQLTIIKFIQDNGQMHPDMSEVEFVQDGDLNKSLTHFCEEVLEDNEQAFLDQYMGDGNPSEAAVTICHEKAQYCNNNLDGLYGNSEATLRLAL